MKNLLSGLFSYRHFIWSSIKNDLKARVSRSRIGAAWAILQPLAQAAIFAIVLSEVLSAKLPGASGKFSYAVYLLSGTLAWALFSDLILRCISVFIENAGLLKKISFPRACLPLITSGAALMSNAFLLLATLLILVVVGHGLAISVLWLPVLMGLTLMLGVGIGLFWGVINVFLRDVSHIAPVIMQLWFWMTPIVYTETTVPARFKDVLAFNPFASIARAYQDVLLLGKAPDFYSLVYPLLVAVLALVIAYATFRRGASEMVDVL